MTSPEHAKENHSHNSDTTRSVKIALRILHKFRLLNPSSKTYLTGKKILHIKWASVITSVILNGET